MDFTQISFKILKRLLHDGGSEEDEDQTLNTILRICACVVLLCVSFGFGCLPYFWNTCRASVKLTGLANAFSSGIFLGIAMFHLLPEAAEGFENYFKKEENFSWYTQIPFAYMLSFLAYALILFIEKIAFDSHALIEHDHGDAPEAKPNELSDDDSDEEDIVKNVISTQGKIGSFIAESKINQDKNAVLDKNLLRASNIRKSIIETNNGLDLFNRHATQTQTKKVDNKAKINENDQQNEELLEVEAPIKATSDLTPYLLLLALSFHGLFEGVALGLQRSAKSSLSLILAISAHKWAEAFTLGLSFAKTKTEKPMFFKMISIFSLFTPIGIVLGMILTSLDDWVSSSFMSLSVGTFIYIGASEIIVEEFSISRYKWQKYFLYLVGGLFIAGLTVWEAAGGEHHEHDEEHNRLRFV